MRVTSITTEWVRTLSRVTANNAALDNALEEMAQNTAKQERSVFFAGRRARQRMASLNDTGGCFLARRDRLLGTSVMGSIRPELERRRAAAFRTWTRFRPVWFRSGVPLRVRRLFFQALVVSFLYTGLEALRMRSPDYEYLDRFVLGRKTMREKATIRTKLEDGTDKKRTVDRRKVWDFLGLVPTATELRARRLQWYQNLMKDPTAHQNVLFSFFGKAPFESDTIFDENGRIRESTCGRARQWQEDLDGLGVFDSQQMSLKMRVQWHQTHKHGYRHPLGIVTVTNTCRNIYRDRRAVRLMLITSTQRSVSGSCWVVFFFHSVCLIVTSRPP